MKVLKLGTIITDKASGLKGMLIILSLDMDNAVNYAFQPSGLNPKTQQPLDCLWLTKQRIINGVEVDIDIPVEILGSKVKDKATGFNGIAVQLYYYLNGCVHFDVKPKGVIEETGESIAVREFDIRRLEGKQIKELSETELSNSKKKTPSPEARPPFKNR